MTNTDRINRLIYLRLGLLGRQAADGEDPRFLIGELRRLACEAEQALEHPLVNPAYDVKFQPREATPVKQNAAVSMHPGMR